MPRQFNKIEDKIKKKLISSIHRGRIEVFVTIEGEGIMDRNVRGRLGITRALCSFN